MKFDLTFLNWLAHIADPKISISTLAQTEHEKSMLGLLISQLLRVADILNESPEKLDHLKGLSEQLTSHRHPETLATIYADLQDYFTRKQWLAVVIPSGADAESDAVLCDPEMLCFHVRANTKSSGLVFQFQDAPDTISALLNVHESLNPLLKDNINWPGVLIWIPGGDAIFLPIGSVDFFEIDIEARLQWLFSQLFSERTVDLGRLKIKYQQVFPEIFENEKKTLHILHLSDLYIGSRKTSFRLFQMQQCIRHLVEELGETGKIVPVISGNFMENPSENHFNQVHQFWDFLSGMGTEEPLLVFGNNDVRKDGNINENYRNAIGFQNSKITWYANEKLAIISVNTVVHGNLPQGAIGEEQLEAIEYEIERKQGSEAYTFVILLHHLPILHETQTPALQGFYNRILGEPIASANVIENADLLFDFVKKHSVTIFLHGHQQAPLIGKTDQQIPVLGCGRSIGKTSKFDGHTYFNFNIISLNRLTQKMSSRLLAVRMSKTGLASLERHEITWVKH